MYDAAEAALMLSLSLVLELQRGAKLARFSHRIYNNIYFVK